MASKYLIYGLVDPRTQELRYVGKSCRGMHRPRQHSTPWSLNRAGHNAAWLRQLAAEGFRPDIEVLEEHASAEALPEAERFFIAYLRGIGCRLTNLTDGGDGAPGRKYTPAALAKMSRRGCRLSNVTREKMSAARRGVGKSPEHKAKIAAALKGRPRPIEVRQKQSATIRAKRNSDARPTGL